MEEQNWPRVPYKRMMALMRYRGLVGGDAASAASAQQQQLEDAVGQLLDGHAKAMEQLASQAVAQIPNQAARDLVSGTIGAQLEMQRQAMEMALRQAEDMAAHAWRAYGDFASMLGRAGFPTTSREQKK